MGRQPIPLTRTVYVQAYTGILSDIGAPLERDLGKFNLPAVSDEERDSYTPLIPSVRFLQFAMLRDGIDDFGLRASQRLEFHNLTHAILASVCHHSTLNTVLQTVCRLARFEDNILRVWLERRGGNVRVCSTLLGLENEAYMEHSHWVQNMMLVYIIRHFAGQGWVPKKMGFESNVVPGNYAREHLDATVFLTRQPCSWIELPLHLLGLTRNGNGQSGLVGSTSARVPLVEAEDFVSSLKAALFTYVGTGCPHVHAAAELAGTSVRTLQRELALAGLSYRELVQQVRFEEAARLLRQENAKIVDIGYAVGYAAPSHFTRAFTRIAGVSPRQFRKIWTRK